MEMPCHNYISYSFLSHHHFSFAAAALYFTHQSFFHDLPSAAAHQYSFPKK
jgi:hypothetical protein